MRSASAGAIRQPVDPKPAIGIEHHLDDARVFEIAGDRRPERSAQHARAAGEGFGSKRNGGQLEPPQYRPLEAMDQRVD